MSTTTIKVPFFRPRVSEDEINEVVSTLQSGWLTTGPRVRRFEEEFAAAVGAKYAIALNSCTAALHLAVDVLNLKAGQGVLVPTMTFAATAEIVRYLGGIPIMVDCEPDTTNMDLEDAARKLQQLRAGELPDHVPSDTEVVGIIPVHVGGLMMDIGAVQRFAAEHNLWVVEDAAHSFPAAWRKDADSEWKKCGENTSTIACFSFYANKTITTGEGGMAVTDDAELAERIRLMSLHGLSRDAWDRYSGGGWDYKIVAPGYKYNLTDIAAAIGLHQLASAEELRLSRQNVAHRYYAELGDSPYIELPADSTDRLHSWHLFPIKLNLDTLKIDRNEFIEELKAAGVGCSVHWRPLHLHPYYQDEFGWTAEHLPVATRTWERCISLPIFAGQREDEVTHVIETVRALCARHAQ